jgi:hypothetical protein
MEIGPSSFAPRYCCREKQAELSANRTFAIRPTFACEALSVATGSLD